MREMNGVAERGEGATVACPKCGQPGTLKVDTFRAAGKEYKYWVVRHGARRCILTRWEEGSPPAALAPPAVQPLSLAEREEVEEEVEEREEEEAAPQPAPTAPRSESYPREFQRRAWYAAKVGSSVGSLKENPTRENLERLKSTAAQVTERLGVPTADLIEAAERFLEAKSEAAKMRVNETLTLVICRIFSSLPLGSEKRGGEAVAPTLAAAVDALEEKLEGLAGRLDAALSSLSERREAPPVDAKALADAVAEEVVKRLFATAQTQPARPSKVGGVKRMVLEILSDGRERTRAEIEREIERRFGASVGRGSLSGRLSELAKEGAIVRQKKGGTWYWRIAGWGGVA